MELQAEPFLLHDVVRRQSKDGRPFLLATLRDRTGQIGGVFWDVPLTVDVWVKPGLAVLVSGRVSIHKDAIQVSINDLARAAGLDLAVFLPASRRPRAEMLAELRDDVAALAQPWQTLAGNPNNVRAWVQLAEIYRQLGEFEQAAATIEEARAHHDPATFPTAEIDFLAAQIAAGLGNVAEARELAESALLTAGDETAAQIASFLAGLGDE